MPDIILIELREIANLMKRAIFAEQSKLSSVERPFSHLAMCILAYLCKYRGKRDIFQRDIEQKFCIRRSTATDLLANMERKGFITRESVESDARLKKIVVTDKTLEMHKKMEKFAREFEQKVVAGITDEEKQNATAVLQKISANLSAIAGDSADNNNKKEQL